MTITMRMQHGILALGLLVGVVLATSGTSDGASTAGAPAAHVVFSGNATAGKEAFTQYCSICHAVGAKGFIGPSIAGVNWTTPGLHAIVRGGVGGYGSMPAFNADAVTDKNIADIAAYLLSLAPTPAPKPATTASSIP
jgi:mono/diheme cytochrome c family protein